MTILTGRDENTRGEADTQCGGQMGTRQNWGDVAACPRTPGAPGRGGAGRTLRGSTALRTPRLRTSGLRSREGRICVSRPPFVALCDGGAGTCRARCGEVPGVSALDGCGTSTSPRAGRRRARRERPLVRARPDDPTSLPLTFLLQTCVLFSFRAAPFTPPGLCCPPGRGRRVRGPCRPETALSALPAHRLCRDPQKAKFVAILAWRAERTKRRRV